MRLKLWKSSFCSLKRNYYHTYHLYCMILIAMPFQRAVTLGIQSRYWEEFNRLWQFTVGYRFYAAFPASLESPSDTCFSLLLP